MKKEDFLKIINDNVKDYNKKVKFIFISPYANFECHITSIGVKDKEDNMSYLSNYYPPELDKKDKHLLYAMINKLNELSGSFVSFMIYSRERRNNNFTIYNYKMTVNETDNFIELIIQE